MKKAFLFLLLAAISQAGKAQKTLEVSVTNPSKTERTAQPVVLSLSAYGMDVKSAIVQQNGQEVPSQLDDLNGDGRFDELCFLTDIGKKSQQTFRIELLSTGMPRSSSERPRMMETEACDPAFPPVSISIGM